MTQYDYDLFVIGAGSGGVRAARLAAELGARVGIAEEYRIGGTCVIRGCVPKKLLVYASRYRYALEDAASFGWNVGEAAFDWPTLIGHVQREVDRLSGVYARILDAAGVTVMPARATLEGRNAVNVSDREAPVTAQTILIATGGHPMIPDLPGKEHLLNSNECFQLEELPRRIAIIGAGYIGVEFASIFAGLGSEVTLIYRGEQILREFDVEIRDRAAEGMRAHGIDIRVMTDVAGVERAGDAYSLHFKDGDRLEADAVLAAAGRAPNTVHLGLQRAGVELGWNGDVVVDEFSRSSVDNIYAVGDVTHRVNLTPVAIHEAHAFAQTVFNDTPTPVDHTFIPTAVFGNPEIAAVGLTEEQARERCRSVDIYKASFTPLKYTLAGRAEKMFLKLVVDGEAGTVLGCHVLGPDAAEIVQMAAIPVRMGANKSQFDATMALHPSAAEELVTMRHRWEPPKPVAGSDAAA